MKCPKDNIECVDHECGDRGQNCVLDKPIVYSDEYHELVNDVLEEARWRGRIPRIRQMPEVSA